MSIVTGRENVLKVYGQAALRGWTLPCFCTENLTTTEAILTAAKEYSEKIGTEDIPVIVAITCQYSHRAQATYYTQTRRWDTGMRLFLADLQILTAPGAPFDKLKVMVHLDHVQFDDDRELLGWDLGAFSSIMYDASALPLEENIALTREFVKERGEELVIEGACDEIADAGGQGSLTTAEKALRYVEGTGADLIVANLGTEHRASAGDLVYRGDLARSINGSIGNKIVLHGASSVPAEQITRLYDDGVCKVNLWTALERDSSPELLRQMAANACKIGGAAATKQMITKGILGGSASCAGKPDIGYFTTFYRQHIIFEQMKEIIAGYFKLWYR